VATCLFTGAELNADTKDEHTIQRALGGRVKSTIVTSSEFNELCGGKIDPFLARLYAIIMNALEPVLPSEAQAGLLNFRTVGEDIPWKVAGGKLVLTGTSVIDRNPDNNRPTSAIGPDFESFKKLSKDLGVSPVRTTRMLAPQTEGVFDEEAVFHWGIEVAALKSLLLTFDHLLADEPNRFTRSPKLDAVRKFVRAIAERASEKPNTDALVDLSLGIQLDDNYLDLYEKLRNDAGLPRKAFQHTLIISANHATRSLDAVFWAFETDPHAFRLSYDWEGDSFTYVMTNGILAGQQASDAVRLEGGYLLGKQTSRCNRLKNAVPEPDLREAATEVMERRHELYRQAVDHVERNSNVSVQEQLHSLATLNVNGDHRLSSAVFSQLVVLFGRRYSEPQKADAFLALLIPLIDGAAADILPPNPPPAEPASGWDYWLALYRQCLDVLQPEFGLPGNIFTATTREIIVKRPGK
jgi:hypothetical protein